jgi:hypothetical protein
MNKNHTYADALRALHNLAAALGYRVGTEGGDWNLEPVPNRRMWRIVEIDSPGTHHAVLDMDAHTATEIVHLCIFALNAYYLRH